MNDTSFIPGHLAKGNCARITSRLRVHYPLVCERVRGGRKRAPDRAVRGGATGRSGLITVGEGLHEGHQGVFFGIGELQVAQLGGVHGERQFGLGPAGHLFAGGAGRAGGENVAGVVEVDDLLQALEVAVVAEGLDEVGRGLLVHVAQGGRSELIRVWEN